MLVSDGHPQDIPNEHKALIAENRDAIKVYASPANLALYKLQWLKVRVEHQTNGGYIISRWGDRIVPVVRIKGVDFDHIWTGRPHPNGRFELFEVNRDTVIYAYRDASDGSYILAWKGHLTVMVVPGYIPIRIRTPESPSNVSYTAELGRIGHRRRLTPEEIREDMKAIPIKQAQERRDKEVADRRAARSAGLRISRGQSGSGTAQTIRN